MKHHWHFLSNLRSMSAFAHDIFAALIAWEIAFLLRFNFDVPSLFYPHLGTSLLWLLPLQAIIFVVFGLYQGVWRFASLPDLKRILRAVLATALIIPAMLLMLHPPVVVPRSVLILYPLLLILLMGGSRLFYRAWKEYRLYGANTHLGQPVILIGAHELGVALLKELNRSSQWRVVGILDDDVHMKGRLLEGVRVLGSVAELPVFTQQLAVAHMMIALPKDAAEMRQRAVTLANQHQITALTLPAADDLISGKVSVSQIRRVDVEDLLGRESVTLDNEGLFSMIADQAVLVSGAGGSIGSELCRQILKFKPSKLVCLDVSEYALYQLEQSLDRVGSNCVFVTGDVKNARRIKQLLAQYAPKVVFHAAAYKHVPLMENMNVAEALSNNVLGTYVLANACKEAKIEKFVLISTDKAVNPTNVMGASKRLAEMVCQGMQEDAGTRFIIVRFGNVLGSSGSVIPKFRAQIAQGGPVTVTHPEITRYFMSIPEAAQLVMQAGLMGAGGEIFVLDMGEPVKIAQLARDMIRLSGLHDDEVKVVYTGLRPGEKLYEELLADDEHTLPTPHHKLRIAVARSANITWVKKLLKWIEAMQDTDEQQIKKELKIWVEEYTADTGTLHDKPVAQGVNTIH